MSEGRWQHELPRWEWERSVKSAVATEDELDEGRRRLKQRDSGQSGEGDCDTYHERKKPD